MKAFTRDALIRAVKTAAQSALAMIGAGAIDVLSIDWLNVVSVSGGAALISILMSLTQIGKAQPSNGVTDSIPLVSLPTRAEVERLTETLRSVGRHHRK